MSWPSPNIRVDMESMTKCGAAQTRCVADRKGPMNRKQRRAGKDEYKSPEQAASGGSAEVLNDAVRQRQSVRLNEAGTPYSAILEPPHNNSGANHKLGLLAPQASNALAGQQHLKAASKYADALIIAGHIDAAGKVLEQGRRRGLTNEAVDALGARIKGCASATTATAVIIPVDAKIPKPEDVRDLVDLISRGRLAEGEALARSMTASFPQAAIGWKALGAVLRQLGRDRDALLAMQQAVLLSPCDAEAHSNLAVALADLGRLDEAVASCRKAIEIKPHHHIAHNNLGNILKDLGRVDEAVASYRRALELKPECLAYSVHTNLSLPILPATGDHISSWRDRYRAGMTNLEGGGYDDDVDMINPVSFYLAYHNENDRSLLEALDHMFRKYSPQLSATSPHLPDLRIPGNANRRMRVGFLSAHLCDHTIGKLYQGFIHRMDRSRFEVVVIHSSSSKSDRIRQAIDALADKAIVLPRGLKKQQAAVGAMGLDVLFYPDIGMDSETYFLAFARLAPVQVVGWGHPDTTGLASMDYFISADPIEPSDAEDHYSERLIRLNRLPCYYEPFMAPAQIDSRLALGLPESGFLYGCPQSLFKIHPDFDKVLAAIAEGDPTGRIVLIEAKHSAWAETLKARWAGTYPILLERVIFLPRLPPSQFMALVAHLDVLLDPIHFGSGNTMYEAMVYGTPTVTWPGRFMRGRIVAGAYRQMGVAEAPIATRLEDYAPLALALGRDAERRQRVRSSSLRGNRELFGDLEAVREFELFLRAAVDEAALGKRLPEGWRPPGV